MSTLKGNLGKTDKGNDDSSMSDSSDQEYELQEIRPEVFNSKSSLSKRKRRKIFTCTCVLDWVVILIAFIIYYGITGLFAWAMIEALLSNTQNCLIAFGVIWIVFMIVFFTALYIISTRLYNERLARAQALADEEARKREENIARNRADNA